MTYTAIMAKAKSKTCYLCRTCGSVQSRWMGKCPDCGTWDALESYTPPAASEKHNAMAGSWATPSDGDVAEAVAAPIARTLPEIETADVQRLPTGIGELDRVLGGGFVPASVVLLGGDPGIGKSTLMLQAAAAMARPDRPILYVTSEESAYQTRLRAERLIGSDDDAEELDTQQHLYVLADTNLARIVEQARRVRPAVMVIDSVQMIYKGDLDAAPGSVTQLRRCCTELVYLAKVSGITIVLVGHVTKEGTLAGPKLLEHLVDVVLAFDGDRHHAHRVVRGMKNRFGTTLEVGLFEMAGNGLREIDDPAAAIDPNDTARPGTAVCPVMHGSRCVPVEIQALTAPGILGNAKRKTSGLDANRLTMLIAVLEQHGGLRLGDQDVFTSVVGGLKVHEPAADLALALAIAGAHYRRSLPAGSVVIGEVGLDGRVRCPPQIEQRLAEARRRGFTAVTPVVHAAAKPHAADSSNAVATVAEALQLLG